MNARMLVTQRVFYVCLMLASTLAWAGGNGAKSVACGDLLMTPGAYVLTADLVCVPPAVVILAPRVYVDLNGYSITNALPLSGEDQPGVVVAGNAGAVVHGAVSGFGLAVLVTGNENKVSDVMATGNLIGIFLCCGATGNRIVGNTANDNVSLGSTVGVGIQDWEGAGTNNAISGNTANGNEAWGIIIGDPSLPEVKGDKITGNVANYNGNGGLLLFEGGANGNVVRGNEFIGNTEYGIVSFSDTPDFPAHNVIQGNTALDSGIADLVDAAPVCENTWKSNTFSTEISVAPSCTD
jgi:Periplasmic copper-binding protein (NosD)